MSDVPKPMFKRKKFSGENCRKKDTLLDDQGTSFAPSTRVSAPKASKWEKYRSLRDLNHGGHEADSSGVSGGPHAGDLHLDAQVADTNVHVTENTAYKTVSTDTNVHVTENTAYKTISTFTLGSSHFRDRPVSLEHEYADRFGNVSDEDTREEGLLEDNVQDFSDIDADDAVYDLELSFDETAGSTRTLVAKDPAAILETIERRLGELRLGITVKQGKLAQTEQSLAACDAQREAAIARLNACAGSGAVSIEETK